MTIAELIQELSKLPQDHMVVVRGYTTGGYMFVKNPDRLDVEFEVEAILKKVERDR